jgi:hypothetical protein
MKPVHEFLAARVDHYRALFSLDKMPTVNENPV